MTLFHSARMENRPYQPIDCNYYDIILAAATLRQLTVVQYYDQAGALQEREALIADVFTRDHAEFLRLSSGELIRLDDVVAIDGEKRPAAPTCWLG